ATCRGSAIQCPGSSGVPRCIWSRAGFRGGEADGGFSRCAFGQTGRSCSRSAMGTDDKRGISDHAVNWRWVRRENEGTAFDHLSSYERLFGDTRLTAFQKSGEGFSLSQGERAGVRASVPTNSCSAHPEAL